MTPEQWQAAKALYFDMADLAPPDRETFLRINPSGDEVRDVVWELLAEPDESGPDLSHACWLPEVPKAARRMFELGRNLLDRFEIVGFLGAGGAGEVYRVFDHQQSVFVALKTLRADLVGEESALTMLREELNTARSITHPNVCRLHDFHIAPVAETPAFFTMELLEGETLAERLRRQGPFSAAEALPIGLQILSGLEAVHNAGIVHRDLKSANVFLTQNAARAVVMDFGLAREATRTAGIEETLLTEIVVGTPPYMAPEQLRGERATFASDIHALGVIFFEMFTGRRPFEGSSAVEIASRRLVEEAPSPRRFAPAIERRWEHVILRCVARDRMRRPQNVREVRELLASSRPALRFSRRALVLAVAAPVAAGIGAWRILNAHRTLRIEVFDFENRTGRPDLAYVCKGTTAELLRRLAGMRYVSAIPAYTIEKSALGIDVNGVSIGGWLETDQQRPRMTVRLVERPNGSVLWSHSYSSQSFDNLLDLQQRIASGLRSAIESYLITQRRGLAIASFSMRDENPPSDQLTRNSAAFDYYLRGNSLLQEGSLDSVRVSIDYFERSVALDSHFALAWASLGEAYLALRNFSFVPDTKLRVSARNCADRVIQDQPLLAEGYALMGAVQQLEWDWVGSENSYDRALTLKSRFPRARRWRAGLILQFARFDEAIDEMQTAFEQDPYDRAGIAGYGLTLLFAGRCRDAVSFLESNIGQKDLPVARFNLGQAYARLAYEGSGSDVEEYHRKALAQAEALAAIERRSGSDTSLSDRLYGLIYSLRGDLERADAFVQRVRTAVLQKRMSPVYLAMIYSTQRQLDQALTAIDEAFTARDNSLLYLRVNIFLENLRGQPRFEAVMRNIHLK